MNLYLLSPYSDMDIISNDELILAAHPAFSKFDFPRECRSRLGKTREVMLVKSCSSTGKTRTKITAAAWGRS